MQPADVIDRLTILTIKFSNGIECHEELKEYIDAATEYKGEFINQLRVINEEMWHIENQITKSKDSEDVGNYYLRLRKLSKQRLEVKNDIAKEYGGYQDSKTY